MKFEKLLQGDEALQVRLNEATSAYEGDKELDEADLDAFAGGGVSFSGGVGVGVCKELGGGVGGSYSPNTEFQSTSGSQMDYVCIGLGAGSEGRNTTTFSFCVIGGVSVDW